LAVKSLALEAKSLALALEVKALALTPLALALEFVALTPSLDRCSLSVRLLVRRTIVEWVE